MRPGVRRAALAAVLAICGLARLAYLTSPVVQFNADEAVTGLMVRDLLDGRLPVFYAGQQYGGALEQYLEAGLYVLTPLPQTELTLRLPLLALSVLTCWLVHRIAREVLASEGRALAAAALYAVSPWFNVIGGVTSLGFYVAGQALATAALWTALRGRLFGTGLVAGLAVWTSVSSLYVLIPVFGWLLPVLGRDGRRWARTAAGFGLGALPLLGWLAVHRVLPVPGTPAEDTGIARRLANLADPVLRQYVGVAYGHAEGGLWRPVQLAVVLGLAGAYVLALVRRRGFALLRADRRPADLLLAVPPVVVVLWAASNSTWYTGTPRYLALTYPLLAVGLAALVPVRAAPVLVAGTALLSAGFFPTISGVGPTTVTRDAVFRQVTDDLVAHGQTAVYADYWTAMPLQYLAGDRLTVAVYDSVGRFPRAQAAVAAAPAPVYVGNAWGHSDRAIRARLDQLGLAYRTRTVDFVTIFEPLPTGPAPSARPAPRRTPRAGPDRWVLHDLLRAYARQSLVSEPGSAGTSTACSRSAASGTTSVARTLVAASTTGAATPARYACSQRTATMHHRSPGVSPSKPYSGRGVTRSLPTCRWNSRNSAVTTAQTVWLPRSSGPEVQQPSR